MANSVSSLTQLPTQVDLADITNVLQFSAKEATGQSIYKGNELLPGWERLSYNVRGNSLVYWISPTDVSVEFMKDVDDVRENLSIRSDSMLHFVFTYYTMNDATWAVLVQRLFTKHITDYIRQHFIQQNIVRVDGNDVFVDGRKFSVSIAGIAPGLTKFHFGINVESKGAPIPVSSLSDCMEEYTKQNPQILEKDNPFLPSNFVTNVVRNFVAELEDIVDDSQKAVF